MLWPVERLLTSASWILLRVGLEWIIYNFSRQLFICEISGSHGGEYDVWKEADCPSI
jgi:hypothetical protein